MSDPNLIVSGLSQAISVEGHKIRIEIYKLENSEGWSLEAVDSEGTSTVWDDLFETDQAAWDEAMKAVKEEGLSAFSDKGKVLPFRKK